ncbi:MAG TPA: VOC family protein, partial [Vicinamibacterales bacterium]|nr:VOC family protein [Vicinamibacterales bacterium]
MSGYRLVAACGLFIVLLVGTLRGQGKSTIGEVFASNNYSPMVANLDVTIRFYHDVLGVPLPDPPPVLPVVWDTESWRRDLHGLQGSPMRFATLRVPSADPHEAQLGLELVEQGALPRHAATPRPQDPGTATLVLFVRDLDRVFARVLDSRTPIVTAGGRPIALRGDDIARALVIRDPDGHFVELAQPAKIPKLGGDLLGARLRLTIADTERTLHLYRDLFGLPFEVRAWDADPAVGRLIGAPGAHIRVSTTQIPHVFAPHSVLRLELVEVSGVD